MSDHNLGDEGLAPFVTDIVELLEGRMVVEAMIVIAQASHDLFAKLPVGEQMKVRAGLAKMIASPYRPGLKAE